MFNLIIDALLLLFKLYFIINCLMIGSTIDVPFSVQYLTLEYYERKCYTNPFAFRSLEVQPGHCLVSRSPPPSLPAIGEGEGEGEEENKRQRDVRDMRCSVVVGWCIRGPPCVVRTLHDL